MVRKNKKYIYYIILAFITSAALFSCNSYNVKEKDGNGNSLLHDAVLNGDISLARKLIDNGADINCTNEQCITPIRLAAFLKRKEMVQLFIERGVSVNYNQKEARSKTSSLFGNNILKYPEKQSNFFLTFDAGDDNTNLGYILDLLKKYHITATFFITGNFLKKHPDDVKRIVAGGHITGNHTLSHSPDYKNQDHLLNELYETEYIFKKVTGKDLTRIWRAPYLQHLEKPWMLRAARNLGYRHIDVSLYSKDWIEEGDKLYLSNDKFINLFKNSMDFKNLNRIDADGTNYLKFSRKSTDYHGIIMLMHTGSYRKNGDDFVYTLEDVILQLISCGYLFDNCQKFED
ncbi:MAG TPA: polysaccharide deacetylase family protein [Spirochaetota bacterium]|nr:polysaccharide deacetylase family protein [Spirochaetota bacterium]